jgi:Adenylate and Guanylate cyclase catalytic domain
MESTGKRERVHLSEQTALQLIEQGREDWVVRREDTVEAKGKGKMVTYWLRLANSDRTAESVAANSEVGDGDTHVPKEPIEYSAWNVEMPVSKTSNSECRNERLAQWNSDLLLELLQRVVTRRAALQSSDIATPSASQMHLTAMAKAIGDGTMVVEEVVEIIDMPEFVSANDVKEAELSEIVVAQLRAFVSEIDSMYNDNPCKSQSSRCSSVHVKYLNLTCMHLSLLRNQSTISST